MRVAFDTNVLVYAESRSSDPRNRIALDLLSHFDRDRRILPAQVLTEFFYVLIRKSSLSRAAASALVLEWIDASTVAATDAQVLISALELSTFHGLTIWDATVLASAAAGECQMLLSEDMHHGFTWSGVMIVNPFLEPMHPLLEEAIHGRARSK